MSDLSTLPGFLRLPPELLEMIFKDCLQSMGSLVRVCKYLNTQAEPFLYPSIERTWTTRVDAKRFALCQLLRTLINRPDLAARVESLKLLGPKHRNAWKKDLQPCFTKQEFQKVANWVRKVLPEDGDQFWKSFACARVHGVIAIMLTLLPNLKVLKMDIEKVQTEEKNLIGEVLKLASSTKEDVFRKLESFELESCYADDADGDCLDYFRESKLDMLGVFKLPAIRYLKLHDVNIPSMADFKAKSLTLATLNIQGDFDDTIKDLLSATTKLRSFQYDYHGGGLDECECGQCRFEPVSFTCANLMAGLRRSKNTLQEIVIETGYPCPELISAQGPRPWRMIGRLGSLSAFTQLTVLEVPSLALFGWNPGATFKLAKILPASLVSLRILHLSGWYGWDWRPDQLITRLTAYVNDAKTEARPLRKLTLEDTWDWNEGSKNAIVSLSTADLSCVLRG